MSIYNGFPYGAVGAVGAASGPMGASGPTGYGPGANGAAGPFALNGSYNNEISFNTSNEMVLKITHDGRVEWYGKPSQAAEILERTISNVIDSKAASAGMRERTYVRACQSLLARAREMTKDEFIAHLEESIANRKSKVVLLALEELSKMDEADT